MQWRVPVPHRNTGETGDSENETKVFKETQYGITQEEERRI